MSSNEGKIQKLSELYEESIILYPDSLAAFCYQYIWENLREFLNRNPAKQIEYRLRDDNDKNTKYGTEAGKKELNH